MMSQNRPTATAVSPCPTSRRTSRKSRNSRSSSSEDHSTGSHHRRPGTARAAQGCASCAPRRRPSGADRSALPTKILGVEDGSFEAPVWVQQHQARHRSSFGLFWALGPSCQLVAVRAATNSANATRDGCPHPMQNGCPGRVCVHLVTDFGVEVWSGLKQRRAETDRIFLRRSYVLNM
jgi:hypothetical protein